MTTDADETHDNAASIVALVGTAPEVSTKLSAGNSSPEKPRRNLTQAFEALCINSAVSSSELEGFEIVEPDTALPTFDASLSLKDKGSLVSPTNVAEFGLSTDGDPSDHVADNVDSLPDLNLHLDLRRELSVHCIRRVSVYSIIHDVNKECSAMAQHDPLVNLATEKDSPLVMASLHGNLNLSVQSTGDPSQVQNAVIDEEQWLLGAIASRTPEETCSNANADCPSTFLQAMGEKDYENPVQSVTGHSRTQLWKPSRSWWEAKSGKNPWIEPASHNKRWRYLWPLIHYHKFLAKCIKKLKRNGVDVKVSISPVSVFLREEVCAVSDHLAAVSLFDSDEWMSCLQYFQGWTVVSASAETKYRKLVGKLSLRSLSEQGDIESPLLRNQIDEFFLRTMAAQREQLKDSSATAAITINNASTKKSISDRTPSVTPVEVPVSAPSVITGHPPMYPRVSPQQTGVPRQIHGVRRPRYFPQQGWYGWEAQPFQDSSSVHSELSANSFPQQPQPYDFTGRLSGHMPPGYYPPATFPGSAEHSQSSDSFPYNGGYPTPSNGWMNPYMAAAYAMQQQQSIEGYYSHPMPASPVMLSPSTMYHPQQLQHQETTSASDSADPATIALNNDSFHDVMGTPFKYDLENSITQSPYWSHLDQATIAMGLATPAKPPTPITPLRRDDKRDDEQDKDPACYCEEESVFPVKAQAPLLRQHYYSVGTYNMTGTVGAVNHEGYVPPSPATQFMMSPHSHPNASFAYSYGYGFSPRRPVRTMMTPRNIASKTIPEKTTITSPSVVSQPAPLSLKLDSNVDRQSPSTTGGTSNDLETSNRRNSPA